MGFEIVGLILDSRSGIRNSGVRFDRKKALCISHRRDSILFLHFGHVVYPISMSVTQTGFCYKKW